MHKIIFYLLISIAHLIICQPLGANIRNQERLRFEFGETICLLVADNIIIEMLQNNFRNIVDIRTDRVGSIKVKDKTKIEISYSSYLGYTSYSVWESQSEYFGADSIEKERLESYYNLSKESYNDASLSDKYTYEEWNKRAVYFISLKKYIKISNIDPKQGVIKNITVKEALESMEITCGFILVPPEGGQFRLMYTYSGRPDMRYECQTEGYIAIQQLELTLYEDDIELFESNLSVDFGEHPQEGQLYLD